MVIGAGPLPELLMAKGCTTLANAIEAPLRTVTVGEMPDPWLAQQEALPPAVLRLCGDPGRIGRDGCSWLDALGAWRIATLVLALPNADGSIPGCVPATLALCESRRVPVRGLFQLSGHWNRHERLRDGLPWTGWVSAQSDEGFDRVVALLKAQCMLRTTT